MSDNLIGATTAIFIVSLSISVDEIVDVAWSTRDGTAKAGTDYQAANGVVSFLPGETQKQIEVIVYGQNVSPTGDKNFFINLMPPTNAVLGTTLIEAVIKVEDEAGVPVTSVIVAQGKRGLKGDPGLSAYEQAVLMGYEGTVEQWMQEQADAAAAAQRASDYAANAAAAATKAESAATSASFLGNIFPTPEAGVDPVTGVANGAYYNVRSPDNDSFLIEYQNVGGVPTPSGKSYPSSNYVQSIAKHTALPFINGKKYDLNQRVQLDNGEIVQSTVSDNENNPNENMSGWKKGVSASNVFDKIGLNQQEINDKQADRNKDEINARDWGILPTNLPEVNSVNWFNLNNAFPEREALDIFVPIGTYNFSEGFYVTRPHHIYGIGVGELSKTIFNFAGATPVGTVHYKGAVFIIHPSTIDDTSGNGATLPAGQVGTSGTGAVIDFIKVMNSSEHGIIKNAPSYLNGVAAMNNAKHGILTVANTGGGRPRISGIANQGTNTECAALFNGWSGIIEIGDDANVIKNDTCLSAYNNYFGFYDASLLGGVCINNQAHVNVLGDYVQQGSPHDNSGFQVTPSKTVYIGNYAEEQRDSTYSTNGRSIILGATGAQPGPHNTNVMNPSIVGPYTLKRFSVTQDLQAVYDRRGKNFVSVGLDEILFGSADAPNSNLSIKNSGYQRVVVQIGDSKNAVVFFLEDFSTTLRAERPWFLNGLTMGSTHYQTAGTSAPTIGIWDTGNIVWNENPASGGKIGWVCVAGGSPGVWKAFGTIDS